MSALGRAEAGYWLWLSAFSRYAEDPLRGTKQDDSVAVPSAAGKRASVANLLGRSARSLDSLQFSAGHEANPAAIGGPEWLRGDLGSRQPLGRVCTHRT